LLDRFGLAVEVRTPRDLAQRMEVVRRREAFDRDAQSFLDSVQAQQSALREQLVAARRLLPKVEMPDAMLEKAAEICMQLGTDGLRGELSLMRAAKAAAALNRQKRVNLSHLKQVAPLVLRHRLRRDPLDETDSSVRVAMVLETL
jgi:magnesium chelatase subunit I